MNPTELSSRRPSWATTRTRSATRSMRCPRSSPSRRRSPSARHSLFPFFLTIFVLACFVGYYVVWRVTPALHSPLMSGHQCHLLGHHRGGPHRVGTLPVIRLFQGDGLLRRHPGFGEHFRRLHRDAANALACSSKKTEIEEPPERCLKPYFGAAVPRRPPFASSWRSEGTVQPRYLAPGQFRSASPA